MPATPPPAVPAPESATTALYRAALGPVNAADHLPAFDRFDAAGRAGPAWNWAAGLLTLNWMLFRQLWVAALVYLVCVGGLVFLVLGPLRDSLQWPLWPQGVRWGALATLVLLSVVIPGAWGTAILHADTRRRITRAVRQASTVREACAALAEQASTRRRWWGLVLLNAALALAAVAVVPWGTPGRSAAVSAAVEPAALQAVSVAAPAVAVPADTVAPAELPAPVVAAPASEPEAASVSSPSPATVPASGTPAVSVARTEPSSPAPPEATPAVPQRANPGVPQVQVHGINVGLFAERANAEKAQSRLVDAGFPAILQSVESSKGVPLTRVRVGPLANRAQAEQAAERIRAMGLDAQIFAPGA